MNFRVFNAAVQKQFSKMSEKILFETDIEPDNLWENYLNSFPEGSNPIFRERTDHDCSCCRQFIKTMGGVVALDDNNEFITLWDIESIGNAYDVVANAMAALVRSSKIKNVFKHYQSKVGVAKNFQNTTEGILTWEHFNVTLKSKFLADKDLIGSLSSQARSTFDVFFRSLNEVKLDSVQTVLDLINQNAIYRGAEFKSMVEKFYNALKNKPRSNLENFAWKNSVELPDSVTHIRNKAIGILILDIDKGLPLEDAVRIYESVVAPTNYKRPTALVTKAQIEKAKKTIEGLGLMQSLERRHACIDDISVNDVIFIDRSVKKKLVRTAFEDLADSVKVDVKNLSRVQEMSIHDFLSKVVPTSSGIELLFENKNIGNLVSLIAPTDATAPNLFKWDNGFSWTYNGELADSMKHRVKARGGNVTGELCCRLSWDYEDDLDFHMEEPDGFVVYFGNVRRKSSNGGMLDLDANGCDGPQEFPVENIFYEYLKTMKDGTYQLIVHNYTRRSSGSGFDVEIDLRGEVTSFKYDQVLGNRQRVKVADIVKKGLDIKIKPSLPKGATSKQVWGIFTGNFHKVSSIMLSPNYWGDRGVGNKHYFFMIKDCVNEGSARGFHNEFLRSDLDQHRKVLELVGSKMVVESSAEQLSGLGFSSTKPDAVVFRVIGSVTRLIKVIF